MGCDIHAVAEFRKDGKWNYAGRRFKSEYFKEGDEYYGQECYSKSDAPISARNYDSFAVLADVRNGIGFAGVVTGDRIEPISDPRGIPDDFSMPCIDGRKFRYDDGEPGSLGLWLGDHSHTWITLAELEAYPWDARRTKCGWIYMSERKSMLDEKRTAPDGWCGMVSGGNIRHISIAEMDEKIASGVANDGCEYVAELNWPASLINDAWAITQTLIPNLRQVAEAEGVTPEDVRVVMGFDS